MKRGRPTGSLVRQHILEILFFLRSAYGYEIYKHYCNLFPKITLRNIYYHLRKGVDLEEITIHEIRHEKGTYSWGNQAEKIYYQLGPLADPRPSQDVTDYFSELTESKRDANEIKTKKI